MLDPARGLQRHGAEDPPRSGKALTTDQGYRDSWKSISRCIISSLQCNACNAEQCRVVGVAATTQRGGPAAEPRLLRRPNPGGRHRGSGGAGRLLLYPAANGPLPGLRLHLHVSQVERLSDQGFPGGTGSGHSSNSCGRIGCSNAPLVGNRCPCGRSRLPSCWNPPGRSRRRQLHLTSMPAARAPCDKATGGKSLPQPAMSHSGTSDGRDNYYTISANKGHSGESVHVTLAGVGAQVGQVARSGTAEHNR
jgi:hypothetical protein